MTDTSIMQSVQQMPIKRIVAEYEMQKYNLKVNAVCCFSDSVIEYIYIYETKEKKNQYCIILLYDVSFLTVGR